MNTKKKTVRNLHFIDKNNQKKEVEKRRGIEFNAPQNHYNMDFYQGFPELYIEVISAGVSTV